MSSFYYLATPYSRWPGGLDDAHETACRLAARLVRAGLVVYCPIAHTHPIARIGGLDPLSHELWLAQDQPLMDAAAGLVVARIDGWDESVGVAAEIKTFRAMGKPILYWDP